MWHIRQKNSNDELTYTVVITNDWLDDLVMHPCMIARPDVFEVVNAFIPSDAQYLKYQ